MNILQSISCTHLQYYFLLFLFSYLPLISSCGYENFVHLADQPDGGYYVMKGDILFFRYYQEYSFTGSAQSLAYRILDRQGNTIRGVDTNGNLLTPDSNEIGVSLGDNFIALYFQPNNLIEGQYYMMEITSIKGEKQYCRFRRE